MHTIQKEQFEHAAERLKVLAHPVRLQLVLMLLEGPQNVSQLYERLELPQSTVSQHLAKLKTGGYIQGVRSGLEIYYQIADENVSRLLPMVLNS